MPYHQYVSKALNVMILCIILRCPAVIALYRTAYFLHYRTKQFEEQQTQDKVTDAVNDVIEYPRYPPGHRHIPSAYEQVRYRTEKPEKQPEEC